MVPFEPIPGRPVYCRDCIAKIKSGEIQPLKGTKGKDLRAESFAPLASLGIEFSDAGAVRPRPRGVDPRGTREARMAASADMRPKNFRQPRERKEPDHQGLQASIAQALGSVITETAAPAKASAPETPKPQPEQKKISLSALASTIPAETKKSARPAMPGFGTKEASGEHMSALAQAIQKAQQSAKPSTSTQEQQPRASQTQAPLPSVSQEETFSEPEPAPVAQEKNEKTIREVPEDILRKVLE
jgi:hypothetical protein